MLRDDEDVEAESPDFPGLGGLAAALVQPEFLDHRDKEVRLFTVLACMEIFAIVSNYEKMVTRNPKSILSHVSLIFLIVKVRS